MAGIMYPEVIEARIQEGLGLIEAMKTHRGSEINWVKYLESKGLSKSQASDRIRMARRFGNSDLLPLLLKFGPNSTILMKLCSKDIPEEVVRVFLTTTPKYISDNQCIIALADIQSGKLSPTPTLNGFNKAQENKVKTDERVKTPETKPKDQKQEPKALEKEKERLSQKCQEHYSHVFLQGDNPLDTYKQIKNLPMDTLTILASELEIFDKAHARSKSLIAQKKT